MLTQLFQFLDPVHVTSDLAGRLRALADDSEQIQSGRPVSPIMLQTAPLLEYWVPALRPQGLQLIGQVTGHPLLGDCMILTSPLWFADPESNWVRTLSRFYRLGPPADPDEARLISSLRIKTRDTSDEKASEDRA
jgi:hypothetical protein